MSNVDPSALNNGDDPVVCVPYMVFRALYNNVVLLVSTVLLYQAYSAFILALFGPSLRRMVLQKHSIL